MNKTLELLLIVNKLPFQCETKTQPQLQKLQPKCYSGSQVTAANGYPFHKIKKKKLSKFEPLHIPNIQYLFNFILTLHIFITKNTQRFGIKNQTNMGFQSENMKYQVEPPIIYCLVQMISHRRYEFIDHENTKPLWCKLMSVALWQRHVLTRHMDILTHRKLKILAVSIG